MLSKMRQAIGFAVAVIVALGTIAIVGPFYLLFGKDFDPEYYG